MICCVYTVIINIKVLFWSSSSIFQDLLNVDNGGDSINIVLIRGCFEAIHQTRIYNLVFMYVTSFFSISYFSNSEY